MENCIFFWLSKQLWTVCATEDITWDPLLFALLFYLNPPQQPSPQSHCSINHLLARCQDRFKYTVTKIKWMKWISSEYKCNKQPQMCPFVMVHGPYLLLIYKITVVNKNSYSVSTVRGLRKETVYYIYTFTQSQTDVLDSWYWPRSDMAISGYIALDMQQI